MDGNRKKAWKKVFPNIDISKKYLSDEDLKKISIYFEPDLNLNNSTILSKILLMDREFKQPLFYQKNIKSNIVNISGKKGGSKWTKDYWILRGWTEAEAVDKISTLQKTNSKRSLEYWIKRGYSIDDAKNEISKHQSKNSSGYHIKLKESGLKHPSVWSKNFWLSKGYSELESEIKVYEYQSSNTKKRKNKESCFSVDYWIARNFTISDYEDFMRNIRSGRTSSKSSLKFFNDVNQYFENDIVFYGEKEFGKYIPNIGYRKYDYVNLTKRVVIEYHGDYWHSTDEAIKNDLIKKQYIESLGFKYMCIFESDVNKNYESSIQKIRNFIDANSN